MGTVITAGMGQIPARQGAIKAGLPTSVPALSINKVCASSLKALNLAAYLLEKARFGYRLGDGPLVDSMVRDGLTDPANGCHMAVEGSDVAKEFEVSRERQDAYAFGSQQRYAAALTAGRFNDEPVPGAGANSKGTSTISADEQPRPDTSLEGLARLKPVFKPDGTITAGNAPGVNDGAAALLVMSGAQAKRRGLPVLAEWLAYGESAADTPYLATVPASSIPAALKKLGVRGGDMSLFEINEGFAPVAWPPQELLRARGQRGKRRCRAPPGGHP